MRRERTWSSSSTLALALRMNSQKMREEKVGDWLEAGTHMVILINPRTRTVTVYSSLTDVSRLTESGVLTFGDVIPGFTYQVSELFV